MFEVDRLPIVYLDTSFLSQFAKLEMGRLGVSSHAEKWEALLARLRQEVQQGTLICPASQFPIQEALLSSKILPQFRRVQSELSGGYFFKDWMDIPVHQATNQVLVYLGRSQDINPGWSALTRETPYIPPAQSTREYKEDFRQLAERLRKEKPPEKSYAEQYEVERAALINQTFLKALRQLQGLPVYRESPDPVIELYTGYYGMLIREAKVLWHEVPRVIDFLCDPKLIDQIPFIRIFASIWASARFSERQRGHKGGDLYDVAALASAMPYCSIVTTDKSMREHIEKRLHFHTDYEADIFTPTAKSLDALLERLEAFTQ